MGAVGAGVVRGPVDSRTVCVPLRGFHLIQRGVHQLPDPFQTLLRRKLVTTFGVCAVEMQHSSELIVAYWKT